MATAPTTHPGALQMTEQELAVENERGRMVAKVAVLAVTLYTASFILTFFTMKGAEGKGNQLLLNAAYDNKVTFIFAGMFLAVAVLLSGSVLAHIVLAARSRSRLVPKAALVFAIGGPAIYAIVSPLGVIAVASAAKKFADADVQTIATANELLKDGFVEFTRVLEQFARLVVAVAWVMTGMYGMRLGLLTRLVGLVAVAIGAVFLFAPPFAAFLQVFWIGAVAIQLVGDGSQVPPAWKLGRPVPWSEVAAAGHAPQEDPADFEKPGE